MVLLTEGIVMLKEGTGRTILTDSVLSVPSQNQFDSAGIRQVLQDVNILH